MNNDNNIKGLKAWLSEIELPKDLSELEKLLWEPDNFFGVTRGSTYNVNHTTLTTAVLQRAINKIGSNEDI